MSKKEIKLNLATGEIIGNKIINIKEFYGNKKETIDFVNKEFRKYFLTHNFDENLYFNIAYKNIDELHNINNWIDFNSLINGNIFILEDKKK